MYQLPARVGRQPLSLAPEDYGQKDGHQRDNCTEFADEPRGIRILRGYRSEKLLQENVVAHVKHDSRPEAMTFEPDISHHDGHGDQADGEAAKLVHEGRALVSVQAQEHQRPVPAGPEESRDQRDARKRHDPGQLGYEQSPPTELLAQYRRQ